MTPKTPSARVQNGVYGILGSQIAYTMSPRIFRTVFDDLGWPAVYGTFDRDASALRSFLRGASQCGITGLNVTTPHKVKVVSLVDRLDDSAHTTGAVNTVSFQDGKSIGYNTDLEGAHTALKPHASSLRSGTALILGVGGAARAVASALDREFGMSRITFASRSNERGGRFLNSCARLATPNAILETIPYDPALIGRCLDRAVLLVNATPVGTRGYSSASPLPRGVTLNSHLVVFDLVYRPRRTRLLTQAEAAGCRTIGGWGMLLAQAEESFRIWTGRGFPVSSIRTLAGMT